MKTIDVFNGDADGVFALLRLRKTYHLAAAEQHRISCSTVSQKSAAIEVAAIMEAL